MEKQIKYYDNNYIFNKVSPKHKTLIRVIDKDTFAEVSENTCCLNFASGEVFGGGYAGIKDIPNMPISTQEEFLFRHSNLEEFIEAEQYYPLKELEGLFLSGVLTRSIPISIVIVPAVINPNTLKKIELSKSKARRILDIAAENNVEKLILGAWGCGVYANSPLMVAKIFKNLLKEFDGIFAEVIFAIPSGKTYEIFKEKFS